jgi:3-phosphoshikimate 1-carboxyvinyltransferase
MRFLTAFLSKIFGEWTITGTERMCNRPIALLVDAINSLGGEVEYMEKVGYPPLRIKGHALRGGEISIAGNVSSQYISALLMIAPIMEQGLKINLTGEIISKPYINLTINLMRKFGVESEWLGNTISVSSQDYIPIRFTVEGDWSAASYWYAIASLCDDAEITLQNLFSDSLQGDSAVSGMFADLGIKTSFNEHNIKISRDHKSPERWDYDFVNQPDLAQTFVVVCCLLNVKFRFTGLQSLKIKETDRIEALKNEMRKLGFVLSDYEGSILEWNGERCESVENPIIDTYEDHRMAMAFAPASLKLGSIRINNPGVVSKSYPRYWNDLLKAGFEIKEE